MKLSTSIRLFTLPGRTSIIKKRLKYKMASTFVTGRPLKNIVAGVTPSDIEISQSVEPMDVNVLARNYGIMDEEIIPYGKTKAKIDINIMNRIRDQPNGNVCIISIVDFHSFTALWNIHRIHPGA
jgi:hypothetical protein